MTIVEVPEGLPLGSTPISCWSFRERKRVAQTTLFRRIYFE